MNQDQDGLPQTPKSSSSSTPSGTQALRITVDGEPAPTGLADETVPAANASLGEPPVSEATGSGFAPAPEFVVRDAADAPVMDEPLPVIADEPIAFQPAETTDPVPTLEAFEPAAVFAAPVEDEAPAADPNAPFAAEGSAHASQADEPIPEPFAADSAFVSPVQVPASDAETGFDAASSFAVASPAIEEPAAIVAEEPVAETPVEAAAAADMQGLVSAPEPAGQQAVPADAVHRLRIEELREAVRESLAENAAKGERAVVAADEMSHALSAMMDEARHDAVLIGRKLMEFVQANFENNVEMARNYAGARSMPDIINVHTAYVRRQIDLLSRQAEEFRSLTSEMAAKRVSKIQSRLKA